MTKAMTSFDVTRYMHRAAELAADTLHGRERLTPENAMWAMLREAADVSRSWSAPPRTAFPGRSAMPEAPDTVTEWQRAVFAFEEGLTVTQMYGIRPRAQWTAEQHTHAEVTLRLFHDRAFRLSGDRRRLMRATWDYAAGTPPREMRARYGMSRWQVQRARERVSAEMLGGLRGII